MLTLILVIINVILIAILLAYIRHIRKIIFTISHNLRKIISDNSGFFKIVFLFLFFIEQTAFIIYLNISFVVSNAISVTLAVFALIVVTTASLQAFVWENKYQYARQDLTEASVYYDRELSELTKMIEDSTDSKNNSKKKR